MELKVIRRLFVIPARIIVKEQETKEIFYYGRRKFFTVTDKIKIKNAEKEKILLIKKSYMKIPAYREIFDLENKHEPKYIIKYKPLSWLEIHVDTSDGEIVGKMVSPMNFEIVKNEQLIGKVHFDFHIFRHVLTLEVFDEKELEILSLIGICLERSHINVNEYFN
ncbi:MAG: hypothetical protein RR734_01135 [Bacilli bacterium]